MLKHFFKNEAGDTNIISLLIMVAVILAIVFLFKDYIKDLFTMVLGNLFS